MDWPATLPRPLRSGRARWPPAHEHHRRRRPRLYYHEYISGYILPPRSRLLVAGAPLFPGPVRPVNTMWRKILYYGIHMLTAVTYHEPTVIWLFMIGHSLGRIETCFGPSTLGPDIKTHLKSRFCLQAILEKRGAMYDFEIDVPARPPGILGLYI